MGRFRKNIRTPFRYQTEGVPPVRPRTEVIIDDNKAAAVSLDDPINAPADEEASSTPAPATPTPKFLQIASPPRTPSVKVSEIQYHSIGSRGGDTRLYIANTFLNLTDTMKLVMAVECIKVLGTWELAAEYLALDQEECDFIQQLSDNEKDRAARLDASIKDLEARQLHILMPGCDNKEEKWLKEWNNFHAQPPAPGIPVVRTGDVGLAQRFLRERCPAGAILDKVLNGLPDYIGQDFSQGIYQDDEWSDDEDEDDEGKIDVEPSVSIQQSFPSPSGANRHLPRIPSRLSIVQTADSEAD